MMYTFCTVTDGKFFLPIEFYNNMIKNNVYELYSFKILRQITFCIKPSWFMKRFGEVLKVDKYGAAILSDKLRKKIHDYYVLEGEVLEDSLLLDIKKR